MKDGGDFTISMLADEFSPDELGRISGIEAASRDIDYSRKYISDCAELLNEAVPAKTDGAEMSDEELQALFKSKNK